MKGVDSSLTRPGSREWIGSRTDRKQGGQVAESRQEAEWTES